MNKDLFYALCCLRDRIGYSIFSPLTFYNSDCEWMRRAGVHLEPLWNHIALSIRQYIRNTVNFLVTLGPGEISIMLIFNIAAIFILPFFSFCKLSFFLSHKLVEQQFLKYKNKLNKAHKMICIKLYAMCRQSECFPGGGRKKKDTS